MHKPSYSISFIGAGNVATHLSAALYKAGVQIIEVYSRNLETAQELTATIGSGMATDSLDLSQSRADLFILSVPDHAITGIIEKIILPDGRNLVHTSGSVPLEFINLENTQIGVFYPLQTFSKGKEVDFNKTPICIESESKALKNTLFQLAKSISKNVLELSSNERKQLHLAAVFACNFNNYLLNISETIMQKSNLPFSVLQPLVLETLNKAFEIGTEKAQTGPAIREDEPILRMHLESLQDEQEYFDLYRQCSINIGKKYHKKSPLK